MMLASQGPKERLKLSSIHLLIPDNISPIGLEVNHPEGQVQEEDEEEDEDLVVVNSHLAHHSDQIAANLNSHHRSSTSVEDPEPGEEDEEDEDEEEEIESSSSVSPGSSLYTSATGSSTSSSSSEEDVRHESALAAAPSAGHRQQARQLIAPDNETSKLESNFEEGVSDQVEIFEHRGEPELNENSTDLSFTSILSSLAYQELDTSTSSSLISNQSSNNSLLTRKFNYYSKKKRTIIDTTSYYSISSSDSTSSLILTGPTEPYQLRAFSNTKSSLCSTPLLKSLEEHQRLHQQQQQNQSHQQEPRTHDGYDSSGGNSSSSAQNRQQQQQTIIPDLSSELVNETLNYFVNCRQRLNQMTKTYDDTDAYILLLQEKEVDLELAARIGQDLLRQNKQLRESLNQLESQLNEKQEDIQQLRHELISKSTLLDAFIEEEEENDRANKSSRESYEDSTSRTTSLITSNHNHHQRVHEQQELVESVTYRVIESNKRLCELQDELLNKCEQNHMQQERIYQLQEQLNETNRLLCDISARNEHLEKSVFNCDETRRDLLDELRLCKRNYNELLGVFLELQKETRILHLQQQQQHYQQQIQQQPAIKQFFINAPNASQYQDEDHYEVIEELIEDQSIPSHSKPPLTSCTIGTTIKQSSSEPEDDHMNSSGATIYLVSSILLILLAKKSYAQLTYR